MMKRPLIVIVCGTALLIAVAVAVIAALRNRRQPAPPPDLPVAASPAELRVKAVEVKVETAAEGETATASAAVAVVCGADKATAGRYEARNDALRSIARRRDLPENDVAALVKFLASAKDPLPVERVAALKNHVMNLLRNQAPPPKELAETLIAMIEGRPVVGFGRSGRAGVPPPAADGDGTPSLPARSRDTDGDGTPSLPGNTIHPPVVVDYCIQHLGAMVNELDDAGRKAVRGVLAKASGEKGKPYSGTALYSLAEDRRATPSQAAELKRLTLALCRPGAHPAARMAAIQLAGQRGCREVLPALRETLAAPARDAALDIVSIGSIGLLGDARDIALLSRFSSDRRCAAAVEAAIKRINEREVAK